MATTTDDLEERLAWARRTLADPWRVLRMLEAGFTRQAIERDTKVLEQMVEQLSAARDATRDLAQLAGGAR